MIQICMDTNKSFKFTLPLKGKPFTVILRYVNIISNFVPKLVQNLGCWHLHLKPLLHPVAHARTS